MGETQLFIDQEEFCLGWAKLKKISRLGEMSLGWVKPKIIYRLGERFGETDKNFLRTRRHAWRVW